MSELLSVFRLYSNKIRSDILIEISMLADGIGYLKFYDKHSAHKKCGGVEHLLRIHTINAVSVFGPITEKY
jgi:hypothetical protein